MPDDDLLDGGGQGGAEGAGQDPTGKMDNDAYYAHVTKEPVEAVPLDRFKRVYDERKQFKEHADWRKANEPKFTESQKTLQTVQGQMKYLGERISKHPYLKEAIEELLDSPDGSLNHQALLAKVQAYVKQMVDGGGAQPKPQGQDPQIKQLLEQQSRFQMELQSTKIEAELERVFSTLPAKTKALPAFEGVDTDDPEFLTDVESQLEANTARGKADPDDIPGSVLAAAEQVAKRWQSLSSRILGKQAAGGSARNGAAVIPPKGAAGKIQSKVPDRQKDPEGYMKFIAGLADKALVDTEKAK